MEIPFHTYTQVFTLVILATKPHFTSGLQLHLLQTNVTPSPKIHRSHLY